MGKKRNMKKALRKKKRAIIDSNTMHKPAKYEIYALKSKKKYPITSKEKLLLVIKYFNKVSKADEKEVALNVIKRMNELNIDKNVIEKDNKLLTYFSSEKVINKINKDRELHNYKRYKAFHISDRILKTNIERDEYFPTIDEAVAYYVKSEFGKIQGFNKIKRYIYGCDIENNSLYPVPLGILKIFVYKNEDEFEWSWLTHNCDFIEKRKKEECQRRNFSIEESYRKRIINMGKHNKIMLVPRLSYDRFNNVFMRFTKFDKVDNKINLKDRLNDNLFITSDIHFGKGTWLDDMEKITLINNSVRKNDTLLILGDLGYINNLDRRYLKKCVQMIKCENLILILGNHDVFTLDFYYEIGIKAIYERYHDVKKGYVFSHQPCNTRTDKEYNFHGHIHNNFNYAENITNRSHKINCYYGLYDKIPTLKEYIEMTKK